MLAGLGGALLALTLTAAALSTTPVQGSGDIITDAAVLGALNDTATFAAPLPIGHDRLLLFQRTGTGDTATLRTVHWPDARQPTLRITSLPLPQLDLLKNARYSVRNPRQPEYARYSAVQTSAGLWLVGPQVLLLADTGDRLLADFGANQPVLAGLPDGSVLVFGDEHGSNRMSEAGRIQHLYQLADGTLASKDLGPLTYPAPPAPLVAANRYTSPRYGVMVRTLRDGRVLVMGGDMTASRTAVLDPASGTMHAIAALPHPRVSGATALLPDGRVVVAGAEHLACYRESARVVDVYDAAQDQWSTLPDLPLPLCAEAYGADSPSLAVAPNGDLIAGGSNERQVMLLPADKTRATGYAANWRVVGAMEEPHIGGVLQALDNDTVAVAGGVHVSYATETYGCCHRTVAIDRIALHAPAAPFHPVSLTLHGAAMARRGNRVFLAAGRAFEMTGFGQMRYSRVAELLHLPQGQVEQLPPLPFAAGAADAVWLDDDRVLIKGRLAAGDRTFAPGEGLSSYLPEGSGDAAIYDVTARTWRHLPIPATAARSRLVGVRDGQAFLLTMPDSRLLALDLASGKLTPRGRAMSLHSQDATTRWLDDGHLVVAGGTSQNALVSLPGPCTDGPDGSRVCAEHFVGFGAVVPSLRFETYATATTGNEITAGWQRSTPSHGGGYSAVVMADGGVVKLGWALSAEDQANQANLSAMPASHPVIERSDPSGQHWQTLPLPDDIGLDVPHNWPGCTDAEPRQCRLLLAPDPRQAGRELLFLRAGDVAHDGARPNTLYLRVWWFNPATAKWQVVIDATHVAASAAPMNLPAPLSTAHATLRSTGWQLDTPILWLDRP